MNQEKIGKFILSLRKEKKMTQQELADIIGVTDRAVSHWENGRSIPDVSLFKSLCDLFNISVNELISGERLSKEKLIKQSEENIIVTISNNKKQKNKLIKIIIFLIVILAILFAVILFTIRNKYPKIDLYNFNIQQSNISTLKEMITINKRNIYYYGIDIAVFCEKNEKCYLVNDALKFNQITIDEFKNYLEQQTKSDNYTLTEFYDGGTKVYSKNGIQVMFCNTSEGNKDIYIGSDKMLDDLNGGYCGHKRNQNESYIRTYKVLQSHIYNNNKEYNEVLLENIDGKTGKAIIKNTFILVPGHMYYFYFVTFDEFYDSIENIFLNSILIKIKELENYPDKNDWINEKIIISDKLKNNAELNELENVRMDIIDDTLTNTSAKIRITDYTDHKYIYGTEYRIDKKIDNKWYKLEPKAPQYFNSMAYIPDKNGHLEFDIYWGNTYGKLSKGKYRIVKYALIDKGKCNPKCNHYYFSVEFNIN